MKNVSSLKSNNTSSPKTPGGISKSLLTPCRRLGLSRNWRNKGPSPFISPLSGSNDVKEEKLETRKRKERFLDNVEKTTTTLSTGDGNEIDDQKSELTDIDRTPSRNVELSRRNKSKTLLSAINKSQENATTQSDATDDMAKKQLINNTSERVCSPNTDNIEVISTPVWSKSRKTKICSSTKSKINASQKPDDCNGVNLNNKGCDPKESTETIYTIKEKSPNELSKECIVVIQRKIFKNTDINGKQDIETRCPRDKNKKSSQTLFDSDSDEVPLNQLYNKDPKKPKLEILKEHEQTTYKTENIKDPDEDDDFIDIPTKLCGDKVKKTKSPKPKLQSNKNTKTKIEKEKFQPKPLSQSSYDDDDDYFDNKKTILIRKTYDKVTKPLKAKSTGSITQKDIDDLKARIEAKKKLLLAKTITPDTEELRTLIKKWQKGCQNALMELLDLMKTKFHDKQNMDYSEMLKTLKIPPSLVGYDSENDCFNSPDDASIILGPLNDL